MYLRDKSQYSPENLNALQVCWLRMKEDKIRDRRKLEKIDVNLTGGEVLHLELELREKPLSAEEQKEMQDFETKMLKTMSFGMNLENSDIV